MTILLASAAGFVSAVITWLILTFTRNRSGVTREVVVGATSSILAAIIIWLCIFLFSQLVVPWLQGFTYKGLDISGRWNITLGERAEVSQPFKMTADLKQVTDRVSGVLIVAFTDASGRTPRAYAIAGFLRDKFLAITIEKLNRRRIGLGTSLVEAVGVGDSMKGYLCAYDESTTKTRCDQCDWVRSSE